MRPAVPGRVVDRYGRPRFATNCRWAIVQIAASCSSSRSNTNVNGWTPATNSAQSLAMIQPFPGGCAKPVGGRTRSADTFPRHRRARSGRRLGGRCPRSLRNHRPVTVQPSSVGVSSSAARRSVSPSGIDAARNGGGRAQIDWCISHTSAGTRTLRYQPLRMRIVADENRQESRPAPPARPRTFMYRSVFVAGDGVVT